MANEEEQYFLLSGEDGDQVGLRLDLIIDQSHIKSGINGCKTEFPVQLFESKIDPVGQVLASAQDNRAEFQFHQFQQHIPQGKIRVLYRVPAFQVSQVNDTELRIYPEKLVKLAADFSGGQARTGDRCAAVFRYTNEGKIVFVKVLYRGVRGMYKDVPAENRLI